MAGMLDLRDILELVSDTLNQGAFAQQQQTGQRRRRPARPGQEGRRRAVSIPQHARDQARQQQRDAWQTIMRSHAIANGVFVAAANRIGTERDLTFWGSSFVCGPDGKIIAQASEDREEVLHAELDLDAIEEQRHGWPFLRDRRIDAYGNLGKRFADEATPLAPTPDERAAASGRPAED